MQFPNRKLLKKTNLIGASPAFTSEEVMSTDIEKNEYTHEPMDETDFSESL